MEDVGRPAFGTLLRQLRLQAGLSQEALAERARMSVVTVGALERGARRAPYRDTVALLAEALALGPEERARLESAARPQRPKRAPLDSPAAGGAAPDEPTQPNNLPLQLTNFVGREVEVSELGALLATSRLVTIVGSGGIGKTRTALQIAAGALADGAAGGSLEGVWLVELAPLADGALVAGAIASALGIAERSDRPVLETLLPYLRRRRVLLVLDNCEHLIVEAARIAETILRACPDVRLLATSREPLHVGGEQIYRLPPLAFPPERAALAAEEALRYGAVTLFAERAAASDARFRLSDDSAPAVGEICRRLDGIALAIELAAARVNVLAPRALAQKLDERFGLLTGGSRTALPRQQTMWALIDWSYGLLSEEERLLFRRLSVFANGWTLEAAGEVCGGPAAADGSDLEPSEVLGLLWALVDKSLVVAEPSGDEERYRLLDSTREYARQRLAESGEAEAVARRHATYFRAFGEHAKTELERMPDLVWFARVECELDDVRAALDWSLKRGYAVESGAALAAALGEYWPSRQPREGRMWLETAQERIDAPRDPSLTAAVALALAAVLPLGVQRREQAERAVAAHRDLSNERELARALRLFGNALVFGGRAEEGESALEEALAIARRLGDERRVVASLDSLSAARRLRGDLDGARVLLQEALELSVVRDGVTSRGHSHFLSNLAELEFARGDIARAVELATQARSLFRILGDQDEAALMSANLAAYALAEDRLEAASVYAREALEEVHGQMQPFGLVVALEHVAVIAGLSGDRERAASLLGFTDARLQSLGLARQPTERLGYDRLRTLLAASFSAAELARRLDEGAALSEERAIELALPR
jgi:predicted ATPase/DNA-binding XRE family transcriptional regulator